MDTNARNVAVLAVVTCLPPQFIQHWEFTPTTEAARKTPLETNPKAILACPVTIICHVATARMRGQHNARLEVVSTARGTSEPVDDIA